MGEFAAEVVNRQQTGGRRELFLVVLYGHLHISEYAFPLPQAGTSVQIEFGFVRIFEEIVRREHAVERDAQRSERLRFMRPEKGRHAVIEFLVRNEVEECGNDQMLVARKRNVDARGVHDVEVRDESVIVFEERDVPRYI